MMQNKLDPLAEQERDGRYPAILFMAYLALVAVFAALNIFAPDAMSATEIQLGTDHVLTLWGTNLAVASGIGLILIAVFFSWLDQRRQQLRGI